MTDAGEILTIDYPFVLEPFDDCDSDGNIIKALRWRPGVNFVDHIEHVDGIADGLGKQIITVVSIHKPGDYGLRVFFTRKWQDPDGAVFGNHKLHIKGIASFTTLTRGYAYRFTVRARRAA